MTSHEECHMPLSSLFAVRISTTMIFMMMSYAKYKPVDPKFPGTGLSDIKKSFEKIAMTFLARTKIKGIYHQSYLCLY